MCPGGAAVPSHEAGWAAASWQEQPHCTRCCCILVVPPAGRWWFSMKTQGGCPFCCIPWCCTALCCITQGSTLLWASFSSSISLQYLACLMEKCGHGLVKEEKKRLLWIRKRTLTKIKRLFCFFSLVCVKTSVFHVRNWFHVTALCF